MPPRPRPGRQRGRLWRETPAWSDFAETRAHQGDRSIAAGSSVEAGAINSGLLNGRFGYVFHTANTQPYGSIARGDPPNMTGAVGVPVFATPTSGTTTTTFTVTGPQRKCRGMSCDISYRFQKAGSTAWSEWKWQAGQVVTGARFTPNRGAGTYAPHRPTAQQGHWKRLALVTRNENRGPGAIADATWPPRDGIPPLRPML